MAAVAPTKKAITELYNATLKTSKSFSSYNFREYFVRRTEDRFAELQKEQDSTKLQNLYSDATKELSVLRRSALVNQLYGGWRLAIETEEGLPKGNEGRLEKDNID